MSSRLRIGLVEPYADGHHAEYARLLAQGLIDHGVQLSFCSPPRLQNLLHDAPDLLDRFALPDLTRRKAIVRHWLAYRAYVRALRHLQHWGATHVHFLYGDWNTTAILAALRRVKWSGGIAVTVHWLSGVGAAAAPAGLRRHKRLLHLLSARRLARLGSAMLVHEGAMSDELADAVGSKAVHVAPYPIFPLPPVEPDLVARDRASLDQPAGARLILCLGDTRYDKGADLAIRALARLPADHHLLVAGKPSYFSAAALTSFADAAGVLARVRIVPRFLPDREMALCLAAADLILLPYRAHFSGQSGPLTLAAALGKAVVLPDLPVLASTARRYALGSVFRPEDVDSMAGSIKHQLSDSRAAPRTEQFHRDHSPSAYVDAIVNMYQSVRIGRPASARN